MAAEYRGPLAISNMEFLTASKHLPANPHGYRAVAKNTSVHIIATHKK